MITGPVSFVKACQDYFTSPPHGRKVEIGEFKELTRTDKEHLRDMLIGVGYEVEELKS